MGHSSEVERKESEVGQVENPPMHYVLYYVQIPPHQSCPGLESRPSHRIFFLPLYINHASIHVYRNHYFPSTNPSIRPSEGMYTRTKVGYLKHNKARLPSSSEEYGKSKVSKPKPEPSQRHAKRDRKPLINEQADKYQEKITPAKQQSHQVIVLRRSAKREVLSGFNGRGIERRVSIPSRGRQNRVARVCC